MSSLVQCLLRSEANFLTKLFGFFLLFSFKGSLYILDNSILSDASFENAFFHSVVCLLIFLALSFAEQKSLILMKSSVSYQFVVLWIVSLVLYLKRHHHTQGPLGLFLCFSRNFIVLHITFSSMIYFELVFVEGTRSVSGLIILQMDVHRSSTFG